MKKICLQGDWGLGMNIDSEGELQSDVEGFKCLRDGCLSLKQTCRVATALAMYWGELHALRLCCVILVVYGMPCYVCITESQKIRRRRRADRNALSHVVMVVEPKKKTPVAFEPPIVVHLAPKFCGAGIRSPNTPLWRRLEPPGPGVVTRHGGGGGRESMWREEKSNVA